MSSDADAFDPSATDSWPASTGLEEPDVDLEEAEGLAPVAIREALVEAAWGLPGLRVGYARLTKRGELVFEASSGATAKLEGLRLSLATGRNLLRALRSQREPIAVEDVAADWRTQSLTEVLRDASIGSLLAVPVRGTARGDTLGCITADSARPRTWGSREVSALERLLPTATLGLQVGSLTARVHALEDVARAQGRRLAGLQGLAFAARFEATPLLRAMAERLGGEEAAVVTRLTQLTDELTRVADGRAFERDREVVELARVAEAAAAVIAGMLPSTGRVVRVRSARAGLGWIRGHRAGLERMFVALFSALATEFDATAVDVEVVGDDRGVSVHLEGGGLAAARREFADPATASIGLALARSELALHGGECMEGPHWRLWLPREGT